jgi:hypothetical protein
MTDVAKISRVLVGVDFDDAWPRMPTCPTPDGPREF